MCIVVRKLILDKAWWQPGYECLCYDDASLSVVLRVSLQPLVGVGLKQANKYVHKRKKPLYFYAYQIKIGVIVCTCIYKRQF